MPVATSLNRVSQVDFLAVLPPGLYVFVAAYGALWVPDDKRTDSLWDLLLTLSAALDAHPWSALFVLFVAFLLGSLLRAIPVRLVERLLFARNAFPYPAALREFEAAARIGGMALPVRTVLPKLDTEITTTLFNSWKDAICISHPLAYLHYLSGEARSRFFAGMFWAGVAGLFAAALLTYYAGAIAAGQLAILSGLLVVAFGRGLKHVRMQEALFLFGLHLANVAESGVSDDRASAAP